MADIYLMLSMVFVCKWLLVISVVAAAGYAAWLKRCLVLRHVWSWKSHDHACGQRMGTFHLVTCDRCKEAHLQYKEWWEPNRDQPTLY